MGRIPVFDWCDHGESRVMFPKEGKCPVCEAEQEVTSLRRRLKEAEAQPKDRGPLD